MCNPIKPCGDVVPLAMKAKARHASVMISGVLGSPEIVSRSVAPPEISHGAYSIGLAITIPKLPAVPVVASTVTDCTDCTPESPSCSASGMILDSSRKFVPPKAAASVVRPDVPP